ncbi:X-Pro dipeptidyl-peptidase [Apiospora kogelbergensis]|uniref:X-Pro dipeptidyl-peptidase n=1 Tax=Apiospora kogelbergensis TaxID=1337665 RepID=UPI0031327E2C
MTDEVWVAVESGGPSALSVSEEPIAERINRVGRDQSELEAFYKFPTSDARHERLNKFYESELDLLRDQPFESLDQEAKVDYLLLQNHLKRSLRTLELDGARDAEFAAFVQPFTAPIRDWVQTRMEVRAIHPQEVAASFDAILHKVHLCRQLVGEAKPGQYSKAAGYRAAKTIERIRGDLGEMFAFYQGYDPLFDWWVREPYGQLDAALAALPGFVRERLAGIEPGRDDVIVGEPIGRDGLLAELEAEMIPFSPEELLRIADKEYAWCEARMVEASRELGFGDTWRDALEHVKGRYEPPGSQPLFIKSLVDEGTQYVEKHELVSVPPLAKEAIRMYMIPPEAQKHEPRRQAHVDAWQQPPFRKSHRVSRDDTGAPPAALRGRPSAPLSAHVLDAVLHRGLGAVLGDGVLGSRRLLRFPEDRIGSLFWRMHRCARIVFSLKFHLGQMTPEECVELLVSWVGHERATAEGEVRRSFNGDYSPLYQAGYLLGALQLWKLREETVGQGLCPERVFHDRILNANMMPIELLRALLLGQELNRDFKTTWRFYEGI